MAGMTLYRDDKLLINISKSGFTIGRKTQFSGKSNDKLMRHFMVWMGFE